MSDSFGTQDQTASGLYVPKGEGFVNPNSKAKSRREVAGPTEDVELMPSEINEVRSLLADIQNKYGFRTFTESSCKHFENETVGRFAELGIVVRVYWKDVDVDDAPNSDALYFIPTVAVEGRTERKTIDHAEYATQVQSGELDGKVGTIRPDGTLGDSVKKQIK